MSMQALLAASQSMSRMQTMQSSRMKMEGTANVLRIESKQDGGNGKKELKADELDEKSTQLMGDIMNEAADVNETQKPSDDLQAEADAKEEVTAGEKKPETDTLELSEAATKNVGENSIANVADGEAVTYKADGSADASVPEKSNPAFRATA